jgi:hypothetical protein
MQTPQLFTLWNVQVDCRLYLDKYFYIKINIYILNLFAIPAINFTRANR